jgi:hypothetical protein
MPEDDLEEVLTADHEVMQAGAVDIATPPGTPSSVGFTRSSW